MVARLQIIGLVVALVATTGCSHVPARINAPDVDPEAAAEQAVELYDADRSGSLDEKELAKCPGILARLSVYDQDGDKLVDRNEIAARLTELFKNRVGLTQLRSQVTLRGRPLADANVVFEPEPYLGSEIQRADGTTNQHGSAQMSIAKENLPENVRDMQLLHYGTYKVRITHPAIKIPAKYNTETTLGYETMSGNPSVTFSLNAP